MSLATDTAASSRSRSPPVNVSTVSTGPKDSSRTHRMSEAQWSRIVGR